MKDITQIDKNLLIIGANGFLGTIMLQLRENENVLSQGFSFIASDIENTHIDKEVPFYYIDITDKESTIKKIAEISPDVVLLTAAMTSSRNLMR